LNRLVAGSNSAGLIVALRIAFTPHAYYPATGGAENHSRGLAEGLARRGHDVHVLVAAIDNAAALWEWGHNAAGPVAEIRAGVTIHRLPYYPPALSLDRLKPIPTRLKKANARYARHLERVLTRLEPHVVVTLPHLLPNVEHTLRLREGASWKTAYFPMLHEQDPHWPTQAVADAVRAADTVIALTDHERARLVESYGARPEASATIPPGVEIPEIVPSEPRGPIVLAFGRQAGSKRLDVIYDAMQVVWTSVPEARLVVAGTTSMHNIELDRVFEDDPRVDMKGRVSDDERSHLLGTARLLTSASVIESFGITTLEAWAHRTPVVLPDTPVNRSVVRDGVDGLLMSPDPTGLAAGIVTLLRDPDRSTAIGLEGHSRARSEFTWDAIVSQLEAAFRQATGF
jgi:glycosyltransferase involved in cell wall biosynthesis